jgi:hypothetical protein
MLENQSRADYKRHPISVQLKTNTQAEDHTRGDESIFTAKEITERESDESTDESTS